MNTNHLELFSSKIDVNARSKCTQDATKVIENESKKGEGCCGRLLESMHSLSEIVSISDYKWAIV